MQDKPTTVRELAIQARMWRRSHRLARRRIEAAACAIREQAMVDVVGMFEGRAVQRDLEAELKAMDPQD